MEIVYPPGGGEVDMVEFLMLRRDPLKCDSSGQKGVVYRFSVPPPHPPTIFAVEGGVPGK